MTDYKEYDSTKVTDVTLIPGQSVEVYYEGKNVYSTKVQERLEVKEIVVCSYTDEVGRKVWGILFKQ